MEEEEIRRKIEELKGKLKKEKAPLELKEAKEDRDIYIRTDGKPMTVRHNRIRFFFPNEWVKFYKALLPSQKFTFDLLLHTGARINEVRHIMNDPRDLMLESNVIVLRKTKKKAKKGEKHGKPRPIAVSTYMKKQIKKHIKDKKIKEGEYLKVLSTPAGNIAMKKALKKVGIKDWYAFSLHNVRKTHGNWLKALMIDSGEVCNRLGHDMNTYLSHYASSDVFTYEDKIKIRDILGDIVGRLKGERI